MDRHANAPNLVLVGRVCVTVTFQPPSFISAARLHLARTLTVLRHLNTLAGMVTGIVLGKSCHLPKLAHKAPDRTVAESRHKRFSRWVQNDAITAEIYYLPFVQALLVGFVASTLSTSSPMS